MSHCSDGVAAFAAWSTSSCTTSCSTNSSVWLVWLWRVCCLWLLLRLLLLSIVVSSSTSSSPSSWACATFIALKTRASRAFRVLGHTLEVSRVTRAKVGYDSFPGYSSNKNTPQSRPQKSRLWFRFWVRGRRIITYFIAKKKRIL